MKFAKAWNKRRVPDRVKLARAAGLEGKRGAAAWGDLNNTEQEALTEAILELSARYQKRRAKIVSKTSKTLGVSKDYLDSQPKWIQEGRAPTEEEFQTEARKPVWSDEHQKMVKSCQKYEPAWPLSQNNGRCVHCIKKKPCTAFFAHTGICETGFFEPDKIRITKWSDFQKQFRKANRRVQKSLGG